MSNEPIVIELEGEDTEGHASVIQVTPDDEQWLKDLGDSKKSVRIRIPADDDDTEGHLAAAIVSVVINDDDDDTEGHALRLQFPSVKEADQFRRNVMAAGLITATIALGAIGGAALGSAAGNAVNDSAAISGQSSVANQGQFTVENQGGTALSQRQAANQGQYDATNMGGTPAAAAANQGQYDATNMGGTPQAPSAQDDGDEVHRQPDPNRNLPR
jgi:hypothetical protein